MKGQRAMGVAGFECAWARNTCQCSAGKMKVVGSQQRMRHWRWQAELAATQHMALRSPRTQVDLTGRMARP